MHKSWNPGQRNITRQYKLLVHGVTENAETSATFHATLEECTPVQDVKQFFGHLDQRSEENRLRERRRCGTSKMDKLTVSITKLEEYQSHLEVDLPNIL